MDKIEISNLIVFANHGVFKEEKTLGQKFLLDIILNLNTQDSAITGDLRKSVHYGLLANEINELFKSKSNDLIETCAEEVAQFILKTYSIVNSVTVRVKKPWAPIMLSVDNIFIEITRLRHRAFIGLGSNMGDSSKFLDDAIKLIENDYISIKKQSTIITTKAWGLENQPDFKNKVIEIITTYTPDMLLNHLQNIELSLGRERTIHWGPRTIDLDILFIDDLKIYKDNLIVPHPYIQDREFVLTSLNEISPHFIHPVLNKSIRQMLCDIKNI